MLNHAKVIKGLHERAGDLFAEHAYERELARAIWHLIAQDPLLSKKIDELQKISTVVPRWQGVAGATILIDEHKNNGAYTAVGVDGSQIYPDRHQGIRCFLINVGIAILSYARNGQRVLFDSEPTIFSGDEYLEITPTLSPEFVGLIREKMAFEMVMTRGYSELFDPEKMVIFFDGPLTFWFLEGKAESIKKYFFESYKKSLWELYTKRYMCVGYTSMSYARDLVAIIKASFSFLSFYDEQENGASLRVIRALDCATDAYKERLVRNVTDSMIAHWFLKPGERTVLFTTGAPMGDAYPPPIRPYFFYLHVGNEIARIELPGWIIAREETVNWICAIIINQVKKGMGYPICLAEAHEQAVVKGPDRDIFYHLVNKIGIMYQKRVRPSPKSMRKRTIGI